MSALDDAIAKVQGDVNALTTQVTTSVSNLQSQIAQIATLQQQLANAGTATPEQLAALASISSGIEAETTALATALPSAPAAVAAVTPSAGS